MPRGGALCLLDGERLHAPADRGWTAAAALRFTDVDGNEYLDFNLADTSMFTGYGLGALARVGG